MKELECFNIKKGYYFIDEYGTVYSRYYNKVLKQHLDKDGYFRISLVCEDGVRKLFGTHRLVAMTYINNKDKYNIVMHKDNNKANNHVSNLKWGTIAENTQQAYNDGCCKCNKEVFLFQDNNIYKFISLSELSRYLGYKNGYVKRLGDIAEGKIPHPTTGKLSKVKISYNRF